MKITREQILKMNRKISRELEYRWHTGWVQIHKPHKSKKDYNRKSRSWKKEIDRDFFSVQLRTVVATLRQALCPVLAAESVETLDCSGFDFVKTNSLLRFNSPKI